ncbi:MAG: hypothetical protein K2F99_08525 [Muribaculaceae bacterium]|nr:hypothetical protein [Muribaculaceae bacterium]
MRYENGDGTLDRTTTVDPDFRTLHLCSGYDLDGARVPTKVLEYQWFEKPLIDEAQIAEILDMLKRQYADSCVIRVGSTVGMVTIYQTLVEESQGGAITIRRTPKYKHYIRTSPEVDPLAEYITKWACERDGSEPHMNTRFEVEEKCHDESAGS